MEETKSLSDHDLLTRLDQKLDSFIEEMRNSNASTNARYEDHERRLRHVEQQNQQQEGSMKAYKWVLGVVAAVAGVAEPIVTWFAHH